MRFDKHKPSHWITLFVSTGNAFFCALLRKIKLIKRQSIVVFYGHALNGNLKAFYDYLEHEGSFRPVYVTMFPEYSQKLKKEGVRVLFSRSLRDSFKVASSSAIITDHGAHFLYPAYKHTGIKFIDVWHGIAYKGFDENNFSELRYYDEVWVSSPDLVRIYKEKYVFPNTVIATGYGRTDPLVNGQYSKEALQDKYALPQKYKHIIIVAPTWKQDKQNRSIVPFGESTESFLKRLNTVGEASDSLVIFRAHLNSKEDMGHQQLQNVRVMPYADYPVAEEFLGAADLLVTDWSSIAFDFLAVRKPIIYLDVEPPFEKGFTLDGSYRFGPVASSLDELEVYILKYIGNVSGYRKDYNDSIIRATKTVYGALADGKATERYMKRLQGILEERA